MLVCTSGKIKPAGFPAKAGATPKAPCAEGDIPETPQTFLEPNPTRALPSHRHRHNRRRDKLLQDGQRRAPSQERAGREKDRVRGRERAPPQHRTFPPVLLRPVRPVSDTCAFVCTPDNNINNNRRARPVSTSKRASRRVAGNKNRATMPPPRSAHQAGRLRDVRDKTKFCCTATSNGRESESRGDVGRGNTLSGGESYQARLGARRRG